MTIYLCQYKYKFYKKKKKNIVKRNIKRDAWKI